MNIFIGVIERAVLETIQDGARTLSEIAESSSIPTPLVSQVINDLMATEFIIYEEQKFRVNPRISSECKDALQNNTNMTLEMNELVSTLVENREAGTLKMRKVYMTTQEEKIFDGLIYNLESFLKSLSSKSKNLKKKSIVILGETKYENLIKHTLTA